MSLIEHVAEMFDAGMSIMQDHMELLATKWWTAEEFRLHSAHICVYSSSTNTCTTQVCSVVMAHSCLQKQIASTMPSADTKR